MRAITLAVLFAFLSLSTMASFTPVKAASPGAMSGKYGYGAKGYNQAAKEKQAPKATKMKKPQ
jgi:hypothetical protein